MTMMEILLGCLSGLFSIICFYVKRLYNQLDEVREQAKQNMKDLANHRVEDAKEYPTRKEVDDKIVGLKDDIRGMIAPLNESVRNIDTYLRTTNKNPPQN